MRIHFINLMRPPLSAAMTVAAILAAGMLTKLGHGGWAIGVMAALCALAIAVERFIAGRRISPQPGSNRVEAVSAPAR